MEEITFESDADLGGDTTNTDSEIDFATFTAKSPNPLKKLWIGKCTIYEYVDTTDPNTFQSVQTPVAVLTDEPCRISYHKEQATNIQNGAPVISQSITLFIRPDITVSPGSMLEITQHGVTERYKGSGKPAIYTNHQEIILELFETNA